MTFRRSDMNISASQSPLGTKQILILAAVRHLQPTDLGTIIETLNQPRHVVINALYDDYNYGTPRLIGKGFVSLDSGKQGTIRLTETGRAAVADVALIREGRAVWVGRWEAVA